MYTKHTVVNVLIDIEGIKALLCSWITLKGVERRSRLTPRITTPVRRTPLPLCELILTIDHRMGPNFSVNTLISIQPNKCITTASGLLGQVHNLRKSCFRCLFFNHIVMLNIIKVYVNIYCVYFVMFRKEVNKY